MVTLLYSDTEGWNLTEQFRTEKEALSFLKKEVGTQRACDKVGYNPAPILVIGNSHKIKEVKGYWYS